MISRPSEFWTLPGPRRVLDDICNRFYSANALVVEDRIEPFATAMTIERRIRSDGLFAANETTVWNDEPLSIAFSQALGVDRRPLGAILADRSLAGNLVLLVAEHLTPTQTDELRKFSISRATLNAQDEPPPILMVIAKSVIGGSVPSPWTMKSFVDAIDPLDTSIFGFSVAQGGTTIVKRLKTAIAVEVGTWDLNLVSDIAARPNSDAIRPDKCLDIWVGYNPSAETPAWQNSQACQWGDEFSPHSAWLAKFDPPRLTKRVWTGQVAALLPWIEQFRLRLTEAFQAPLRHSIDGTQYRSSVEDLDWGPIYFGLKNASAPPAILKVAENFRTIRNELAHGRPVDWDLISKAIDAAVQFEAHLRTIKGKAK